MLLGRFLDRLQRHAGLHGHGSTLQVHVLDTVHSLEREHQVARRAVDPSHEAGATPVRHDRLASLRADPKHGRDLLGGGRPQNCKRGATVLRRGPRNATLDLLARQDVATIERGADLIEQLRSSSHVLPLAR